MAHEIKDVKNMGAILKKKVVALVFIASVFALFTAVAQTNNSDISVQGKIYFVGSFDGLDLREEPGLTGKVSKKLPQYTKLIVLERLLSKYADGVDIVDEFIDYWYKVDTGNEIGWVFGAYLTDDGLDTNPENPVILGTVSDYHSYLQFPNLEYVRIYGNSWWYYNLGTIKVYDNPSKEANFTETNLSDVSIFFSVSETEWLYLLNLGFVFIYDLPNKNEGNEYEMLQKYPNIGRRYGPLLEIYCDNTAIQFWDDYNTDDLGTYYKLVEYNEEYDEVVICETVYEREVLYHSYKLSSCDYELKAEEPLKEPEEEASLNEFS